MCPHKVAKKYKNKLTESKDTQKLSQKNNNGSNLLNFNRDIKNPKREINHNNWLLTLRDISVQECSVCPGNICMDDSPHPSGQFTQVLQHSLAVKPILQNFFKDYEHYTLYFVKSSIQNRHQRNFEICKKELQQWCCFLEWVIVRFTLEFSVFKIIKMPSPVIL